MLKKLFLIVCIPCFSYANNRNILECSYNDLYKTGCSVYAITLAENEPFQMDFLISYKYSCSGHSIEVGVETETGFFPFVRSSGVQTVVATGQARLFTKALNSTSIYPKVFQKDCVIEVIDFKKRPSVQTLLNWQNQSEAQIEILNSSLDNFQLANDIENIRKWNRQKLFLMKNNIQKLLRLYPDNIHFKIILQTVKKTIDYTPNCHISAESKETLVNFYANKLQDELNSAKELLELFKYWNVQFREDLSEAILNVRDYVN